MGFGDLLKGHLKSNKLLQDYKSMAHFFVHECGWSQEMFDEAELEFMNDVLEEHIRKSKKRKK